MYRRQPLFLIACLLLTAAALRADTVQVVGGSVIQGAITSLAAGKVVIKTDFAGTLTIDQAKVTAIRTDTDRSIRLASGSTLVGRIERQGDTVHVLTANGAHDISGDSITAVWTADADSPEALAAKAAAPKWTANAALNIAGSSGNRDSVGYGGEIRGERKSAHDRLLLRASGRHNEVEGDTNTERFEAGVEYEHNINELNNWYARTLVQHDAVKMLDLQTDLAVGYGHYFWKEKAPNHYLLGRVGLLLRNEDYEVADDKQTIGLDLGLLHEWQLREWVKLRNVVTFTPAFEDVGDYQVKHESSIDLLLANSKAWALRAGIANDYRSQPAGSNEPLDTTYFLQLVWTWKQGAPHKDK